MNIFNITAVSIFLPGRFSDKLMINYKLYRDHDSSRWKENNIHLSLKSGNSFLAIYKLFFLYYYNHNKSK